LETNLAAFGAAIWSPSAGRSTRGAHHSSVKDSRWQFEAFVGTFLHGNQITADYALAIEYVHCDLRASILLPRYTAFAPADFEQSGLFMRWVSRRADYALIHGAVGVFLCLNVLRTATDWPTARSARYWYRLLAPRLDNGHSPPSSFADSVPGAFHIGSAARWSDSTAPSIQRF